MLLYYFYRHGAYIQGNHGKFEGREDNVKSTEIAIVLESCRPLPIADELLEEQNKLDPVVLA